MCSVCYLTCCTYVLPSLRDLFAIWTQNLVQLFRVFSCRARQGPVTIQRTPDICEDIYIESNGPGTPTLSWDDGKSFTRRAVAVLDWEPHVGHAHQGCSGALLSCCGTGCNRNRSRDFWFSPQAQSWQTPTEGLQKPLLRTLLFDMEMCPLFPPSEI